MQQDYWFPNGIVLKGTRTGSTETLAEPYSFASAVRLARTYASLWLEAIEWWGIGDADEVHYSVEPRNTRERQARRERSRGVSP